MGLLALVVLAGFAPSESGAHEVAKPSLSLFQRLAGRWSGAGHAGLTGALAEPVRCTVDFTPVGDDGLHVFVDCASPTYRAKVDGTLSLDGERVSGALTETTYGVPGKLYAITGSDGLQGIVSGMGVAASMTVTLHGNQQSVTLQGTGGLKASAAVILRRV